MEDKGDMKDCVFCKIAKGEIGDGKLLETDNFFAVKDINPQTSGHSLIIPKKHYKSFLDIPSSLSEEFFDISKDVIAKLMDEEKAGGFNLIMNNFKVAGQIVPHAHLHIIPRKEDDGFRVNV